MRSNRKQEGNVLFNDTLNTFYLRLYGVKNKLLPPPFLGLLFPISCNGSFICTIEHTGQYISLPLLTSCGALVETSSSSMDSP